jgi:hypothetical protein
MQYTAKAETTRSLPLSAMRRLGAIAGVLILGGFGVLVFDNCGTSDIVVGEVEGDFIECSLTGSACRPGTGVIDDIPCAPLPGETVTERLPRCFNSTRKSQAKACADLCQGYFRPNCESRVVENSFMRNQFGIKCPIRSSRASAQAHDLVTTVVPTKVSISSPTLDESLTTEITSGQIVLGKSLSSDMMSSFDVLRDLQILLKDVPLCLSGAFSDALKHHSRPSDSANCGRHLISEIEITNSNIATLIPRISDSNFGTKSRDLQEKVLPAEAATFVATFLIDDQPSRTEIPLMQDLLIQFDSKRKQATLSGKLNLLFGAISLNVGIGNTGR